MNTVRMILDEAALLGHMDAIDSAVGIGRGYGVRCDFYYQSLGQLRKCFPDGQEQVLLSNASQVFFAVNDPTTADYVSNRIGEETVVLESGGTSRGSTWQQTGGAHPSDSHGGSFTANSNWALQARKVFKPEEVAALPPRVAITFTPGVPPICTWLLRHYEEKDLVARATGRRRRRGAGRAIAKSLFTFAVLLGIASMATREFRLRARVEPRSAATDRVEGTPNGPLDEARQPLARPAQR